MYNYPTTKVLSTTCSSICTMVIYGLLHVVTSLILTVEIETTFMNAVIHDFEPL